MLLALRMESFSSVCFYSYIKQRDQEPNPRVCWCFKSTFSIEIWKNQKSWIKIEIRQNHSHIYKHKTRLKDKVCKFHKFWAIDPGRVRILVLSSWGILVEKFDPRVKKLPYTTSFEGRKINVCQLNICPHLFSIFCSFEPEEVEIQKLNPWLLFGKELKKPHNILLSTK